MSVLRSIEGKIESLFEGVFGRAFRSHVQPVELARKLAKEMDGQRSVSVTRVYAPNTYTVYLSPGDRGQFEGYEASLVAELEQYLAEHARRESYSLLTPPRVAITSDDDLAVGEFGIAARVLDPHAPAVLPPPREPSVEAAIPPVAPLPPAPIDPSVTMVYRPALPLDAASEEHPPVLREEITLRVGSEIHHVTTGQVVLGRSKECDIRLSDSNVSRRHCEIVQEAPTRWAVVDLGSTNGTEVNGKPVERAQLSDGDRITVGGTDIVFARALR
jgi:hypothetical protein